MGRPKRCIGRRHKNYEKKKAAKRHSIEPNKVKYSWYYAKAILCRMKQFSSAGLFSHSFGDGHCH